MDIDPNHLPSDAAALQQMVLGLVQQLAEQQRQLRQVQHLLEQLLRWRYEQKRERIDENQLFLFAASVICRAAPTPDTPPAAANIDFSQERPRTSASAHLAGTAPRGLRSQRRRTSVPALPE